ncbi:MAG: hypothetical protein IT159_01030 [Bryobacterales bacterium]|nr:hypothetical protein [Bryobacterales bacterium]
MRALLAVLGFASSLSLGWAQDVLSDARRLEAAGDAARAERLLCAAAAEPAAGAEILDACAQFLDERGNPDARPAFDRLLAAGGRVDEAARRAAARRLVLLSLEGGDLPAAARYLQRYRELGGADWRQATLTPPPPEPARWVMEIPGPFESFRRMAAVSEDLTPEGVVPALARNVVTTGYQAGPGREGLVQTEYMKLLVRYLSQARELAKLAGPEHKIRIEACESTQAGDLLRTLGYRMRGGCGSEVVLETVNAARAFLTVDSGFPLADLEQSLRTNRPFVLDYEPTRVPLSWDPKYLLGPRDRQQADFLDAFLADPTLSRLYLGLSKPDPATAEELRKAIPLDRLRAFAHVLDFFGSMFEIREGRAVVPGGARTVRMWEEMVGAPPAEGARFFDRLISRDDGWLAGYYDALARMSGPVKDYLTEPERMRRFYLAIRGRVTSPGPARPVFQSNTDMLLLTTRLRLEADGRPHIPGGLDLWKSVFAEQRAGRVDERLSRSAKGWKDPDDLVEALFALCRKSVENEPLKVFLALSDLNRNRRQPLEPATAARLAEAHRRFGGQYPVFAEVSALSDRTILQFLETAERISAIRGQEVQSDAAGVMQALVGLWQIFCRQGSVKPTEAEAALREILSRFQEVRSAGDVFNAGRGGVNLLLQAAGVKGEGQPQEQLVRILSGGRGSGEETEVSEGVSAELRGYFEAQRLVSVSLLFEVAEHAEQLSRGGKLNAALAGRLAARLAEIESPRSPLTSAEKNSLQYGYWPDRHIESQRRLNVRSLLERAGRDPGRVQDVRAALAPLLRDSLVGLNYAYYAPPGGQLLRSNSSFVRSHDFLGMPGSRETWGTPAPLGSGWPAGAGGRLVGSLVGLPYALAQAEQNFLIPTREQALIWGDLVPQLILSAKVPRWWGVTPAQIHWTGLHLRLASSLLAESVLDEDLRAQVVETLSRQAPPARVYRVSRFLARGEAARAVEAVLPSEAFVLGRELAAARAAAGDQFAARIRRMSAESPAELDYQAISLAFGTPKPTLAGSYKPELLHLRTFPALMGYSSRILAESWESNALYWAALADEVHLTPAQLNVVVPEWTRLAVERIFASHLEDWPAVLNSLRHVGGDVRRRWRLQAEAEQKAALEIPGRERQ